MHSLWYAVATRRCWPRRYCLDSRFVNSYHINSRIESWWSHGMFFGSEMLTTKGKRVVWSCFEIIKHYLWLYMNLVVFLNNMTFTKNTCSCYDKFLICGIFFCLLISIVNGAVYYQTEFLIDSDLSEEEIRNSIVQYFFDDHDITVLEGNITMVSVWRVMRKCAKGIVE